MLPLSKPALIMLAVHDGLVNWNNFVLPLVLTTSPAVRVLPLELFSFETEFGVNVPGVLASVVLATADGGRLRTGYRYIVRGLGPASAAAGPSGDRPGGHLGNGPANQKEKTVSSLSVLFIGGTGKISSACARVAVERGIDLTALNRGQTSLRHIPADVRTLTADVRDKASAHTALEGRDFNTVVNFVAYNRPRRRRPRLFTGRTGKYVSSARRRRTRSRSPRLPIRESTPLRNPYWAYARDKSPARNG